MASCDVQTLLHDSIIHPPKLPTLRSNQGSHVEAASTGWMQSVTTDTPWEQMNARYERDGYLWVKNLIPREDVLDMREHYFQQLSPTGILLPSTSPRDGIFDPANDPLAHQGLGGAPDPATLALLDTAHATPAYRRFLTHPALRAFVRHLMRWRAEVLVDRAMLRHNCPGGRSTGVHYDKLFLRAGDAEFLTAWVPIGDCRPTGGGLMYLEGSGELGEEMEAEFGRDAEGLSPGERVDAFNRLMMEDGFLSHDAEEFGRVRAGGKLRWLVGDYEAGDVVFHKPYMIHAATKNEDELGRIRLASDLRFYEEGAALDQRWMKVWRHDDGL
ncbi:hypothetical protein HO133_004931 [Letharia lupina]|uniref:Phytanoyl-CoA dioxygenase n=1 Tax=Letharia lupina TaxID=560253 RepID=A0A8H6C9E6_9LECA|nr:uncharacterized protein HO133_004931 [Letharia lupina]KAF6219106.1 hypothetical protein HO133_004931 [Letharia lupina]